MGSRNILDADELELVEWALRQGRLTAFKRLTSAKSRQDRKAIERWRDKLHSIDILLANINFTKEE